VIFGRSRRRAFRPQLPVDMKQAIEAMTAEELRSFVLDVLERLDEEQRGAIIDALIARAASSGWKPASPSPRVLEEVREFARAARRTGSADPEDVDGYLRQGSRAFLAGDYAIARQVFETLLVPLAEAEIDLGQHETVDEVLTVDLHECAARHVASVYTTTPIDDRVEAVWRAIHAVHGVASFWEPLAEMERVAAGSLPDMDAFLPRWLRHIERQPQPEGDWEQDRDRWLREAVSRLEGVGGLERIARRTKRPEALLAWCEALAEKGDWAGALRACEEAAGLTANPHWRGDFLDGAALAAQQLGQGDVVDRLEAAWVGSPSLMRLARWLGAGAPTVESMVERARSAIARCPAKARCQRGLLHLLAGDIYDAAKLLAKAPGLGWSDDDHPGHLLFAAFAGLLARGTKAGLCAELFAELNVMLQDPADMWSGEEAEGRPSLATTSVADLIRSCRPEVRIDSRERAIVLEAMQSAAEKRVEGILANKRRRHYGHAAALVACCLEVSPTAGKQQEVKDWIDELRKKYSRFPAFREELRNALAAIQR